MLRLFATIKKELLVLLRDKAGLSLLFIMPMVMITLMAIIQDAPFRDYQELKIPVMLVNNDSGILGKAIEKGLQESSLFLVHKRSYSEHELSKRLLTDKCEIGLYIPFGASDSFKSNIRKFVKEKMENADSVTSGLSYRNANDLHLKVHFAAGTKPSFKSSMLSSLRQIASGLSVFTMMELFVSELGVSIDSSQKQKDVSSEFVHFGEAEPEDPEAEKMHLNSVQHNVPAWTIFGMFFIVLSVSASIIKEREEGSYLRLRTMPGSYNTIVAGKIISYLMVCLIQCALMLLIGIYGMPFLGLPELIIGNNPAAVVLIAVSCALAATGGGILIGTVFSTHQQATTFGAVSIVMLAALGGIWVPVYIMPSSVRLLAEFSPLYWALEAFHKIFVGNGSLLSVMPHALKLLLFFGICVLLANYFIRRRN